MAAAMSVAGVYQQRTVASFAAIFVLIVHLAGNAHYGFFRDELYFIICGMHPQFGYVDQPPVIPLLSAVTQVFGHSLFLLRVVPALFAAGAVYVTCMLAVEFGGGLFAQILAALTFTFTPVLMSFGMKVSPDSVGLWTWPLIALLIVRIARGADPRWWLLVGAVVGLSLQSKYSVLFYVAALLVGLLLVPQRRLLASGWCWCGVAIAAAIAAPNFIWQWANGFPMIELLKAGQQGKNELVGPGVYLVQEVIITGLVLALVWVVGVSWLLRKPDFRYLGYSFVALIALMMIFHGKHYYPADVYPIPIAAGAAALEAWTAGATGWRWVFSCAVILVGLAQLPLALPVLPERDFLAYYAELGRITHIPRTATETEPGRENNALPSDWADMHGWPEMARDARAVYDSLPPRQRARAVVFAGNYGEASAVAFFTPDVPVISEHNQFWLWGTRGYSGDVLVQIGGSCFHSDGLFRSRTLAMTVQDPWAINYETDLPIWICRGIKRPFSHVWQTIKTYE
jgi:hypothetical protein